MAKHNEPWGWCKHGVFIRTEKNSGVISLELYDPGTGRTLEERRLEPEFAKMLGFVLDVASVIAKRGQSS